MTIFEQLNDLLKDKIECTVSSREVKKELRAKFGINPNSVMLYDCCYNRVNDGTAFNEN